MVLLPESARRTPASAMRLFLRAAGCYLLLAISVGLPVGLMGGPILGFAFGEAYTSGAGYLQLSIAYMAAMGLLGFGTATLQGLGRPGTSTIANFSAALVGMISAFVLMFPFGLHGLILGRLIGCLAGIGVLACFSRGAFAGTDTRREKLAALHESHAAAA